MVDGAKAFLVFASLFFYSWWNIAYLPLILVSMMFNYGIGNALNDNFKKVSIHKQTLLGFGIVSNIALLGYFKYADFFLENFNLVFDAHQPLLHLALPLAISFFTFQQIAYLVDSYRGETAEYDFLNYALFVTFFPQLIAGPIVHHAEMMPQFASKFNWVKKYNNIATGAFIFSLGIFKKVVIADTFALAATNGFDVATSLNMIEAWTASLSYTFQLYFDFSGYTDMAIGAALLFNIRLPINFNSPYKALDIQDFWRRWHITLSRFLRDYIYIPLGGNRKGGFRTYNNLLATFIIGGIWHGAGWTFIFWGFLHGMALVINRLWQQMGLRMPKILAWIITFNFVNIAWVFFRATSWDDAIKVLSSMFDISTLVLPEKLAAKLGVLSEFGVSFGSWFSPVIGDVWSVIWLFFGFVIALAFKNSTQYLDGFTLTKAKAIWAAVAFSGAAIALNKASEFLYFNF